jgi:Spy/CpxP family protein refolding chaperone
MSTKSRTITIWSTIAVALATTLAIASPAAQSPGGRGPQRGGPGREFGPFPLLRQLDLTDTQRQQIQALVQEGRKDDSAMKKMGDLHRDLNAAIFADVPDTAKIDQLKASIAEAESAGLAERIDLQLKIAQILTPEQRQKARELPPGPGRGRGMHH